MMESQATSDKMRWKEGKRHQAMAPGRFLRFVPKEAPTILPDFAKEAVSRVSVAMRDLLTTYEPP